MTIGREQCRRAADGVGSDGAAAAEHASWPWCQTWGLRGDGGGDGDFHCDAVAVAVTVAVMASV